MGEKLTLNLFYEGEEYKEGEIDIKQFAPSLLAFADVIEEVNNILNDNKRLKTKINANFEKKCFKVEMKIDAMDLIKSITNQFLKFKEQYSIENILEIAGFIVKKHSVTITGITFVTGYIM